jgi:hypothetical protein
MSESKTALTKENRRMKAKELGKKAADKIQKGQLTRVGLAAAAAGGLGYAQGKGSIPAEVAGLDTDLAIGGVALVGALMAKKAGARDAMEGIAMGALLPYLAEYGKAKGQGS